MKAGIITWHYYPNFGSSLQAYALQEACKSLGVDIRIINYRNPKFGQSSAFKDFIRYCLSLTVGMVVKRFRYPHLHYMIKYLNQTRRFYNEKELAKYARMLDVVVCGSDQIWAPNVYNPIYFASFFNGKKISYAASIGLSKIPDELVVKYREHLSGFSFVGVREEEGKQLLKERCSVDAEVVLDPTLLLHIDRYKKMERPVRELTKPFVFCYFLNANHQYKDCVVEYASCKGFNIVGFSVNENDESWMTRYRDISACEFLWLIHHADMVLTDSYHGTIFSLLYHKDFRTYIRFSERDPVAQNSRIRQLKCYFGIENNIQDPNHSIGEAVFDYERFEVELTQLREKSLSFLNNALKC